MSNQAGKMTGVQKYTQMFTIIVFKSNKILTGWLNLQVFPTPLQDFFGCQKTGKPSWSVKRPMEMKNRTFTPMCRSYG